MNLYLDTSALVKFFIQEEGRDLAIEAVEASTEVCTSTVTYTEARATFARKQREGALDEEDHQRLIPALNTIWTRLTYMDVIGPLANRAGDLAQEYGLRGYDAVHLATALAFQ